MSTKEAVNPHEWLVISFLIALLLLLTVSTHSCDENFIEAKGGVHHLKKREFDVFIEGDVEFPGKYQMTQGSKVEDLLFLAKPHKSADLRRLKNESLLRKGQKIKIPAKKVVKIFLNFKNGEIKELTVSKGAKLEDLAKLYDWPEGVDLSFLQKRKRLKEGDIVKINF